MYIYAVSSVRSYGNSDEVYFGTDAVFASLGEANKYVRKEMNDIVSGENKEDHELFYGEDNCLADDVYVDEDFFRIDDKTTCFRWEIDAVQVPSSLMQAIFLSQQRKYDIDDVKNAIELEDDLLYDHIRDIPLSTLNKMAALKREKEDNGMAWNDAASAAVRETINNQ